MIEALVEVVEPGRTPLRLVIDGPLVVGRDCDGLLLGDNQISRRHVELRPSPRGLQVTDLGSTNGTFIDGERLTGSQLLTPGAEVRLGAVTIRVRRDQSALTSTQPNPTRTSIATRFDPRRTSIEDVAALARSDGVFVADDEHRHGTITIVFSDIEESTSRISTIGDEDWFQLLAIHNEVVRAAVRRHGGTEVKNQGDGFMLTFPSARRAVQAMATAQSQLAGSVTRAKTSDLRIRVGMHTGEVIVDDDGDLFGRHVNLAARIAGEAAGGEILVSSLTRAILETRGDLRFGPARQVELKGIPGSHTVHPVDWEADS